MLELDRILKEFYRSYADWIEAGAPDGGETHRRALGLCACLSRYMDHTKVPGLVQGQVLKHLYRSFKAAGLDPDYPFDTPEGYEGDCEMHLNKQRLEWVYDRT